MTRLLQSPLLAEHPLTCARECGPCWLPSPCDLASWLRLGVGWSRVCVFEEERERKGEIHVFDDLLPCKFVDFEAREKSCLGTTDVRDRRSARSAIESRPQLEHRVRKVNIALRVSRVTVSINENLDGRLRVWLHRSQKVTGVHRGQEWPPAGAIPDLVRPRVAVHENLVRASFHLEEIGSVARRAAQERKGDEYARGRRTQGQTCRPADAPVLGCGFALHDLSRAHAIRRYPMSHRRHSTQRSVSAAQLSSC